MEIKMSETEWRTIAFAPAPDSGWWASYGTGSRPREDWVAGWLTQEAGDARRVVAARTDKTGELVPVSEPLSFSDGACARAEPLVDVGYCPPKAAAPADE